MAADNGELGLTFTETQETMTSQQGVTPAALPSPLPSAGPHPGAAEDMATEDAACHPKAASMLCPFPPHWPESVSSRSLGGQSGPCLSACRHSTHHRLGAYMADACVSDSSRGWTFEISVPAWGVLVRIAFPGDRRCRPAVFTCGWRGGLPLSAVSPSEGTEPIVGPTSQPLTPSHPKAPPSTGWRGGRTLTCSEPVPAACVPSCCDKQCP